MSRYCGDHNPEPILRAGAEWRSRTLLQSVRQLPLFFGQVRKRTLDPRGKQLPERIHWPFCAEYLLLTMYASYAYLRGKDREFCVSFVPVGKEKKEVTFVRSTVPRGQPLGPHRLPRSPDIHHVKGLLA